MSVTVVHQSPVLCIGTVDSLLVTVWHDSSTLEALDEMARHEQVLIDTFGSVSVLMVFTGAPKNAGPGVKERGDELAKRFQNNVRCNVVLVLARGLSGIVVRTFIAGFSLVSPIPMQSAATVEEATKKLQSAPGQTAELRGNVNLVEQLRAFIEAPAPKA